MQQRLLLGFCPLQRCKLQESASPGFTSPSTLRPQCFSHSRRLTPPTTVRPYSMPKTLMRFPLAPLIPCFSLKKQLTGVSNVSSLRLSPFLRLKRLTVSSSLGLCSVTSRSFQQFRSSGVSLIGLAAFYSVEYAGLPEVSDRVCLLASSKLFFLPSTLGLPLILSGGVSTPARNL